MTLDDILKATEAESAERQRTHSLAFLQRKVEKMGPTRGFARSLSRRFGVIAEIKRKSPSMGAINEKAITTAHSIYHAHQVVAAISVLTQKSHFGGCPEDLKRVRALTSVRPKPILRKDFIFSEYEVYYSRWIGADAILLMANVVRDKAEFKHLHDLAISIGLDVLCEVHDREEIDILPDTAVLCGINSRRFKGVVQKKPIWRKIAEFIGISQPNRDTQTDLNAFALFSDLPSRCLKVAESGMSSDNVRSVLEQYPFNAALIGTSLLKNGPNEMIQHLNRIQDAAAQVAPDAGAVAQPELVTA